MPPVSEEAVVLRTTDFSETSMVVTFFTQGSGKIACVAKGARRLKNSFDSALDPMNQCKIMVYPKSGGALDLVTEAKLNSRFRVQSLVGIYAGFHVVELIDAFTEMGESQPELFRLMCQTLNEIIREDKKIPRNAKLKSPPEIISRILFRFEFRLMSLLGYAPMLEECIQCGAVMQERPREKNPQRVSFSVLEGGLLCKNCRAGHRQVVSLSIPVIKMMRQLSAENDNLWYRIKLEPKILGELRGMWNLYLANRLERPLNTLKWLKR
ncbi:MAG: DNA repair protein RecO [Planctomycetia bacterium]|nr:DNA repair protein RecO [Planctomycetia bacterium]